MGAALALAGPAHGTERPPYAAVKKGTEGAHPLDLAVVNHTGVPLQCTAALAHWFSDALGTAAPGGTLTIRLWHEPETGVLSRLNAGEDRMPVEAITCIAGTARARLALPMRAGPLPAREIHLCRATTGGVRCLAE